MLLSRTPRWSAPSTTSRTWRTSPWSRRWRWSMSPTARWRCGAGAEPVGHAPGCGRKLGVPIENVTVHVTLLGGGFGRKSKCDYVLEAALLSKEVGAPVRVQWTREDDIQHSFYPPPRWSGSRRRSMATARWLAASQRRAFDHLDLQGGRRPSVPDRVRHGFRRHAVRDPQRPLRERQGDGAHRIGWFRSVSNIPRAFAVQSFAAELANARPRSEGVPAGADRIAADHRSEGGRHAEDLWNYGENYDVYPIDTGRLRGVVELAAEKAGWGKTLPKGEGSASPRIAAS